MFNSDGRNIVTVRNSSSHYLTAALLSLLEVSLFGRGSVRYWNVSVFGNSSAHYLAGLSILQVSLFGSFCAQYLSIQQAVLTIDKCPCLATAMLIIWQCSVFGRSQYLAVADLSIWQVSVFGRSQYLAGVSI